MSIKRRPQYPADQPLICPSRQLGEDHKIAIRRVQPRQGVHFEEIRYSIAHTEIDASNIAAAKRFPRLYSCVAHRCLILDRQGRGALVFHEALVIALNV